MIKLVPKWTVALEKYVVDVGEIRLLVVKEFQVIRYATHDHVALYDVITTPLDAPRNQISFRFLKGKVEVLELHLLGLFVKSSDMKIIGIIEKFLDEECLPDAAATINNDEFRLF